MIGQTISHYRITAQLGEGGMGIVYRADDLKLDRQVAIKVLPPRLSQHPEARVRLLREAKAASALQHPNICTIHEIDDTEDGQLFMVMPCYEGETLRQRLDRGPISVEEALELGRQISSALAATHAKGIVHRDLKPGNIMLTNGGSQAVLMDFGLARPDEATQLTRTGATVGTIAYMSPEQVRGERADARSDLWSLGVLLYEMTTGRRPFDGDGEVPVLEAILHKTPEPASTVNPRVPSALAAMIDGMLEKSPDKRASSARQVTQVLDRHQRSLQEHTGTPGAPLGWRLRRSYRAHRRALQIGTASAIIALTLTAWGLWPRPMVGIQGIAVLPFVDLSEAGDQEWFCDGMTDELIQSLGEAGIPRVISRTSTQRFKDSTLSIPQISRELNAGAIVEASVFQAGNRIRINARLLRGDNELQLWAESFERDLKDVMILHAEIAQLIAKHIRMAIDPSAELRLEHRREVDPEAYRAYMKGMYWMNADSDSLGWQRVREQFEMAIALDPTCAEAWAGLAEWNVRSLHGGGDPVIMVPAARAALARAFEINPDLQSAYRTKAHLTWEHEWKQEEAAEAFRRALELNPSDSYTKILYAFYCMTNRRFEEAADAARASLELDPFSGLAWYTASMLIWYSGAHEEAMEIMDRALTKFPGWADNPDWVATRAYNEFHMGRPEEALAQLESFLDTAWDSGVWTELIEYLVDMDRVEEAVSRVDEALASRSDAELPAYHAAEALIMVGEREQAQQYLDLLDDNPALAMPSALAFLYAGNLDRVFELLEIAYEYGEILLSRINCLPWWYDPLHEDPRFQSLVERMGLSS